MLSLAGLARHPHFNDVLSDEDLLQELHRVANRLGMIPTWAKFRSESKFGVVSNDLGFLVEAVHPGFPDCEAKRALDKKRTRWERVRIEFEFKSGNFREHGHDPAGCDVIVCWEHDWKTARSKSANSGG